MSAEGALEQGCAVGKSARLPPEHGDTDGASNRAYYAIFDAARAALVANGHELPRTHRGSIFAFNLRLVNAGILPVAYGRDLNHAERLRLIADYHGDPIESQTAAEMIERAERLVAVVCERLVSNQSPQKASQTKGLSRHCDRSSQR